MIGFNNSNNENKHNPLYFNLLQTILGFND